MVLKVLLSATCSVGNLHMTGCMRVLGRGASAASRRSPGGREGILECQSGLACRARGKREAPECV